MKLTKKFSSTSFNLKQEVFIRRDEEKDLKRVIYIGKWFLTLMDQRTWTVKIDFHTFAGGSVIFDKCYKVWRTVAIKFWHLWMCKLVWGNIWRNDITQFMSGVKELALDFVHVVVPSIDWSIEQDFSPAGPSWMSRYMYSHIWSKIPNIIELG